MKKNEKLNRKVFKKEGEELRQYLMFTRRGSKVENRKGKGSYSRKVKHPNKEV